MKKLLSLFLILLLVGCFIHRLDDRGLVRIVTLEQKKNEATLDFNIRFTHTEIRLRKKGYEILFSDMYIEQDGQWWGVILCRGK